MKVRPFANTPVTCNNSCRKTTSQESDRTADIHSRKHPHLGDRPRTAPAQGARCKSTLVTSQRRNAATTGQHYDLPDTGQHHDLPDTGQHHDLPDTGQHHDLPDTGSSSRHTPTYHRQLDCTADANICMELWRKALIHERKRKQTEQCRIPSVEVLSCMLNNNTNDNNNNIGELLPLWARKTPDSIT